MSRKLFIFIPYLLLVFVQEASLIIYSEFICKNCNTQFVYNVYTPLSATFFYLFFYLIPFNTKSRRIIFLLLIVYLAATLIVFCFFQTLYTGNPYLNSVRALIITLCGLFTLFNYFNLDNTEQERYWLPVIWICIGIITFYPVINISSAFHNTLLKKQALVFNDQLYRIIPKVMSIFMYSCFTYAFYLCKKKD